MNEVLKYNQYDNLIAKTVEKLHDKAVNGKQLVIANPEKMHDYEWEVLRIFQQFYIVPTFVHIGWFKGRQLKKKYGINFKAYKYKTLIPTLDEIGLLEELCAENNVQIEIFEDICNAYYRKDR